MILKPIWSYDIYLWSCANTKTNINLIQKIQNKALQMWLVARDKEKASNSPKWFNYKVAIFKYYKKTKAAESFGYFKFSIMHLLYIII